jgi:hypothetical protein
MDPNAALEEIRYLRQKLQKQADEHGISTLADVERLLELIESLDHWLSLPTSGFLPRDWAR